MCENLYLYDFLEFLNENLVNKVIVIFVNDKLKKIHSLYRESISKISSMYPKFYIECIVLKDDNIRIYLRKERK